MQKDVILKLPFVVRDQQIPSSIHCSSLSNTQLSLRLPPSLLCLIDPSSLSQLFIKSQTSVSIGICLPLYEKICLAIYRKYIYIYIYNNLLINVSCRTCTLLFQKLPSCLITPAPAPKCQLEPKSTHMLPRM